MTSRVSGSSSTYRMLSPSSRAISSLRCVGRRHHCARAVGAARSRKARGTLPVYLKAEAKRRILNEGQLTHGQGASVCSEPARGAIVKRGHPKASDPMREAEAFVGQAPCHPRKSLIY